MPSFTRHVGSEPGTPEPPVTGRRLALGRRAESVCRRRLRLAGWRILDRNWRTSFGELDLVALERRTLVFVEVKSSGTRGRTGPERPAQAVGPEKQRRLRRLAEAWLSGAEESGRLPRRAKDVRFDVVGIVFGEDGSVAAYEHIRDAF